mgnify:FL=1
MVAIIDYGVGNLFSLKSSFSAIGVDAVVTSSKSELERAESIILPGVGAFCDAAKKLKDSGLEDTVISLAKAGKPLMGICLGMQLLFEKSYEYGEHRGLGLIKGEIRPIETVIPKDYKIPHIGWNSLDIKKQTPIFENVKNGEYVYFVHSYYAADCENSVTAVSDYGAPLTASVQDGNIFGCQFHPEKSGDTGLKILRSFVALGEEK